MRYPRHHHLAADAGEHGPRPLLQRRRLRHDRPSPCPRATATPTRSRATLLEWAQTAYGAVQFHELLCGHRFGAIQNLPGALVRMANLTLFLIGQGQDSQRENFVDLGSVE